MIVSVHQPHYLPWLGYFDKIERSDRFVFLDRAQYKKREYQNRNRILTAEGPIWLTVPVITKGRREQAIGEVRIDDTDNWAATHWKTLQTCYGKAPGWRRHAPFFEEVYTGRTWELLTDLNTAIVRYVMEVMGIDTPCGMESDLGTTETSTERILQICRAVGADTYLSGTGGRAYLDEERFAQEGIELRYQEFEHPVYSQRGGTDGFVGNLSAVDYLFELGAE